MMARASHQPSASVREPHRGTNVEPPVLVLRAHGLRLVPFATSSLLDDHPQVALRGTAEITNGSIVPTAGAGAIATLALTLEYCDARFPAYANRIEFGAIGATAPMLTASGVLAAADMQRVIEAIGAQRATVILQCRCEMPAEAEGVAAVGRAETGGERWRWRLPAGAFAYGAAPGRIMSIIFE